MHTPLCSQLASSLTTRRSSRLGPCTSLHLVNRYTLQRLILTELTRCRGHRNIAVRNNAATAPPHPNETRHKTASPHENEGDVRGEGRSSARNLSFDYSSILLCGDGDLSYGASIAKETAARGVKLTASVLESREVHSKVYRNSEQNVHTILEYGGRVRFETDATKLGNHFHDCGTKFDRIQFNFPHWRGKTNARYNRALLSGFFASSRDVITRSGQVRIALLDHQGGAHSPTLDEWRRSWMPARYAAEHNLLLVDVFLFKPNYNLSSYKWQDRPFSVTNRGKPQMYVFANALNGQQTAPRDLQLYSHFQLCVELSRDGLASKVNGAVVTDPLKLVDFIAEFYQTRLPAGIRAKVRFVRLMDGLTMRSPEDCTLATYKVVLLGEGRPITISDAQQYRLAIEAEASLIMKLRRNVKWSASHVCPFPLLKQYFSPD